MLDRKKLCSRKYSKDGVYTAKLINGEACCTTCEKPLKEHK
jgi:hypothetical protein